MNSNKVLKLLVIFVVVVGGFVVALNWGAVFGPGEPEHPLDTDDDVVADKHYYGEKTDYNHDYDYEEAAVAADGAYDSTIVEYTYVDSLAAMQKAYPYEDAYPEQK